MTAAHAVLFCLGHLAVRPIVGLLVQPNKLKEELHNDKENGVKPITILVTEECDSHPLFGHTSIGCKRQLDCSASVSCTLTNDMDSLTSADAVIWNARWSARWATSPPDSSAKQLGQVWLFNFFYEAPIYGGHQVNPEATRRLASVIDGTITYRRDSDVVQPIGGFTDGVGGDLSMPLGSKDMLLLGIISNCAPKRLMAWHRTVAAFPVEARSRAKLYGACGEPFPCESRDDLDDCHQKLFGRFKFVFAFENSFCRDYITEKFWRGFRTGMVPVAAGGMDRSDYESVAPPGSFIYAPDFASPRQLAERLLELDTDDQSYAAMFNWRKTKKVMSMAEAIDKSYCQLCSRLHSPSNPHLAFVKPKKSWSGGGLGKFWYDGTCRNWTNSGFRWLETYTSA